MRSDKVLVSTQWTGLCMLAYRFEYDCYMTWSWVSLVTCCCLMSHAAVGTETELHAAERTSWRSLQERSSRLFKPKEFSPNSRSAAVESLEPLQSPMNSDAMYAVVTASPELIYTRTDNDILDPEIRVSTAQSNWCGGCRLLIAVADVAYPIAVPCSLSHGPWLCVWNARPWSAPQVTTWAGHNVTTDGLPRAGLTELAGRIWPAGRTLPTPGLDAASASSHVLSLFITLLHLTAIYHVKLS